MLGARVYTPATRRRQQSNTTKSAPSKTRTHPPRARLGSTNRKCGAFDGTSRRGSQGGCVSLFLPTVPGWQTDGVQHTTIAIKDGAVQVPGSGLSWGRSLMTPLTLSPAGCPWLRILRSQVKVKRVLVGLAGVSVWQKHHLTFEDHLRKW